MYLYFNYTPFHQDASSLTFQGLPHVVDCVSGFLDSSVDLSLLYAVKIGSVGLLERIWASSEALEHDPDERWTLRRFLRTDKHYRQYLFSKGLEDAVPRQDLETIKWLSTKFQGFTVSSEVVAEPARQGRWIFCSCSMRTTVGCWSKEEKQGEATR
ncbi:hypothetical protein JG688_00018720 [Phytophthora aleatoria]|uniref:Uncharacterized protein n=1 Tax=Phytophthora aleatoria TaxID=2496075 RepID=A0A8J5HZ68_9STRA|nr:hypothetical protein JG688_00018720 [Phytophthora aleatoria]